jgi:hypothetical protein
LSVASKENVYVPGVVGVPERVAEAFPEPGTIDRTGGGVPSKRVQVNGGVPYPVDKRSLSVRA